MQSREAVEFYHNLGLNHKEILQFLAEINNIVISERTLKRVLATVGLYRRKQYSDIIDIALYLQQQVQGSGSLHGYKSMHLKCIQHGFVVTQETIRLLLGIIDPTGVLNRKRGRLKRRVYSNAGPDAMWHMDSYDKLKPYGICINGAIDGYLRHILWLEAYTTNSDPRVVASYYMKAVESRMGCPRKVRADRGTENGHVEAMQKFLREQPDVFLYGSSNHNQRIESWWSILRRQDIQYWISFFQGMKDIGSFDGSFLDKSLIQFCFMQLIQDDLDAVVHLWNTHRIRRSQHQVAPSGRPLTMYHLPHLYGAQSWLRNVESEKTRLCMEECLPKTQYPCDQTVFELCCLIMEENSLDRKPTNGEEAVQLYELLRQQIYDVI